MLNRNLLCGIVTAFEAVVTAEEFAQKDSKSAIYI